MESPRIWSQHNSHRPITLVPVSRKVVVNFGNDKEDHGFKDYIFINPVSAVAICKDKLRSKQVMKDNKIPSPRFGQSKPKSLPVVIKMVRHSGGKGMILARKKSDIPKGTLAKIKAGEMYWEEYIPFDREFRIHVSRHKKGDIFAVEKVLRSRGWIRNLSTCGFVKEFTKPDKRRWRQIVHQCYRFLKIIGLDIGSFDVGWNGRRKKFYIIECNSASGMGDNTRKAYTEELNRIIQIIAN